MPGGSQPYYAMATFPLGTVGSSTLLDRDSVARRQTYNAFFLQDDSRVSRKLVLNLGLRLEVETGFKERYDRQTFFDPDVLNPLSAKVNRAGRIKASGIDSAVQWTTIG